VLSDRENREKSGNLVDREKSENLISGQGKSFKPILRTFCREFITIKSRLYFACIVIKKFIFAVQNKIFYYYYNSIEFTLCILFT